MTPISQDDVTHIAHLARIHLTPKEIKKYAKELAAILDYVRQLDLVDTRGVLPTVHAVGNTNVLRDDIVERQEDGVRDALLNAVPMRERNYVKVKAVF